MRIYSNNLGSLSWSLTIVIVYILLWWIYYCLTPCLFCLSRGWDRAAAGGRELSLRNCMLQYPVSFQSFLITNTGIYNSWHAQTNHQKIGHFKSQNRDTKVHVSTVIQTLSWQPCRCNICRYISIYKTRGVHDDGQNKWAGNPPNKTASAGREHTDNTVQ